MTDAQLRALERRCRETGAEADLLAFLRAAVREGTAAAALADERLAAGLRAVFLRRAGSRTYRELLMAAEGLLGGREAGGHDAWDAFVAAELPGLDLGAQELGRLFAVCPVHDRPLERGVARIAYGLIVPPDGFLEAEQERFPRARLTLSGGCIVTEDAPREAPVRFCAACREAQRSWSAEAGPGRLSSAQDAPDSGGV